MLASLLSGFDASVWIGVEDDVGDIAHELSLALLVALSLSVSPRTLYFRSSRGSDPPLQTSLTLPKVLTNFLVSHALQLQQSFQYQSIESLLCAGVR